MSHKKRKDQRGMCKQKENIHRHSYKRKMSKLVVDLICRIKIADKVKVTSVGKVMWSAWKRCKILSVTDANCVDGSVKVQYFDDSDDESITL